MKRKFEHPAPSAGELTGPKYWRSLDDLAGTLGFKAQLGREFPEGAAELEGVPSASTRSWRKTKRSRNVTLVWFSNPVTSLMAVIFLEPSESRAVWMMI